MTEETRRDLIKVAKAEAENSKVSIRNQRRDANGLLKEYLNEKEISEDDLKRGEVLIQDITDQFVENCLNKKIQIIAYNRAWDIPTISSVACNHRFGGELIADQIIKNNHQEVGLIEGPTGSYVSNERCKGFKNKLKKSKKLKLYSQKGNFTYEGGYAATAKILTNKKISAIFCADDTMAFGCLDYIKKNTKIEIPNDIEIFGYDDISMANWSSYNLSTVKQPLRQMSKLVTQLINDNIKDPDYEAVSHLIQGTLIKRKTSR